MESNSVDIEIKEERLVLSLNNNDIISKGDFKDICEFLGNGAHYRKFRKFEIDFGDALFELSELTEKLIGMSYLFKNRDMQIVLNLGRHNLHNRLVCLDYLKKFNITKYRINYY